MQGSNDVAGPPNGPLPVIEWDQIDKRVFYLVSPAASLTTRATLFPAELVKTRLQIQGKNGLYSGTWSAFSSIVRTEGVRGLYKGFLPNSLGVLSSQM